MGENLSEQSTAGTSCWRTESMRDNGGSNERVGVISGKCGATVSSETKA